MILAAFDPGLSGACAQIDITPTGRIEQAQVWDLPTMGAAKQTVLNGAEIAIYLRDDVDHAVVEHVHAMPGQGVSGMFRFGTAFGQIIGVLQALEIPYDLVSPAKWKRDMSLPGGPAKGEAARLRALQLFPRLSRELKLKRDHNKAEALLLAHWWLETKNIGKEKR